MLGGIVTDEVVRAIYADIYLRLESHIKHAISLVKHQVRHSSQIRCSTLEVVNETTRSRDNNLYAISSLTMIKFR